MITKDSQKISGYLIGIKTFRKRLIIILLPAFIGAFGWTSAEKIGHFFFLNEQFVLTVSGSLIVMGLGAFLYYYLTGGINVPLVDGLVTPFKPKDDIYDQGYEYKNSSIEDVLSRIKNLEKSQLAINNDQMESVVESLKSTISEDFSTHLEEKYSSNMLLRQQLNSSSEIYRNSVKRLGLEIESLSRRANLNLVIGVLTTTAAVSLLVYMVLGNDLEFTDLTSLMSYYIPRVTIVILVETFSFFFLRLYKSNLEEIKYYQAQITWIHKNQVSHNMAVYSDDINLKKEFIINSTPASPTANKSDTKEAKEYLGSASAIIDNLSKTVTSLTGKQK